MASQPPYPFGMEQAFAMEQPLHPAMGPSLWTTANTLPFVVPMSPREMPLLVPPPPVQPAAVFPGVGYGLEKPQRECAPPLQEIEDDDSCDEGEKRVGLFSFLNHIMYLWEYADEIMFASITFGDSAGEHLGCYFANMSKGGEVFFVDKSRLCSPDGFRVYTWGTEVLGGIPVREKHTFFRRLCPLGTAARLRECLVRHSRIPFSMVLNNCHHFERDLRAAAMGVSPCSVRTRSTLRTAVGDMLRILPCCACYSS
ncbi:unnamed protein product [Vitrella brassicaformis CCMP3155]|uniref:PPPDE domain-containing protein n=1 Tax=Vitrella brassicaformis (strain CCMP3155) TaxID=1169540 RepID=A0A0G4FS74_VITBC|nr:unnamed protein product [Vitrella brassicaformis CCMP3155]|eukprot:CEM17508.1 unnamed protein product [Vitrella brassicaformis CCMP3155]